MIEEAEKKIKAIDKKLSNTENSILNLSNFLKYTIDLAYKPLEMWKKVALGDKQRFQNLLFPKGFYFDKENKHIEPLAINQFFFVNPELSINYEHKKKGLSPESMRKSHCVLEGEVHNNCYNYL